MELVLKALAIVVQLALGGFVIWGGWLCFREWLRADRRNERAAQAPAAPAVALEERPESFERVASLVLLALLCTTLAGMT
ncbi:MAG TPA: hypothetical protein VGJ74_07220 [Burkholderiales bacterium]